MRNFIKGHGIRQVENNCPRRKYTNEEGQDPQQELYDSILTSFKLRFSFTDPLATHSLTH